MIFDDVENGHSGASHECLMKELNNRAIQTCIALIQNMSSTKYYVFTYAVNMYI